MRDQLAAVDDHDLVRELGHLAKHVARDEDRPAPAGERAQEVSQPADPFGIKTVRRLVQHQQLGLTEQSGGHAQALSHAKRITADLALRRTRQLDLGQNLIGTRLRDPGRRSEDSEVATPAARRVVVGGLEHRADGSQRRSELAVAASGKGRMSARRQCEAE